MPYAPFFSVPLRDVPRHVSTTAWQRAASGIKLLMKLEPEQTNHMQALRVNHVVRPTCPNNVKTTETMDTMRTWDLAKNPNGTVRVISVVISGCLQRKMVTAEALWILGGPSW